MHVKLIVEPYSAKIHIHYLHAAAASQGIENVETFCFIESFVFV